MRALIWIPLAALLNATVATAAIPPPLPPIPLTTDLPTAIDSQLPDLSSAAWVALPKREQFQIGYTMMLQMRATHQLVQDPEVEEYLNSIGKRLAAQSDKGAADFHYFCVNTPVVNSFAAPGDFVFINSGLILFTRTESELAAVMAHETAHEVQNHIARKLLNAHKTSIESLAAMLGTILLGAASGSGQAIEGGIVASQGLAQQEEIDYSRSVEEEADRVGIELLAAAGFDPEGMPDIFQRLMDMDGIQDSWVPAVLIGHPITPDRVAYSRARAAQFPPVPDTSSPDYYIIKARVRVLTAPSSDNLVRYYGNRIARGHRGIGDQYGYALALMRANHATQAVRLFAKLLAAHPDLHLLYIALGQAQAQSGEMHQALATFAQAKRLFPFDIPVTVRYAQTLMRDGQNDKAHRLLLNLFNLVDPTPSEIELTARAASAAGDLGDAYYYMGEYQLTQGNLPLAIKQYEIALSMAHLNYVQRQRISARLKEVKDYWMRVRARHGS